MAKALEGEMRTDERVLEQWRGYNSIPSDIPPEEYQELADALEGQSPDTAELVRYLRGRAH